MRGSHASGAQRQRPGAPARGANQRDQLRGRDNIDDRVDGADFVKRHRVLRDPMHLGFGAREQREDRDCMFLHLRIEA